MIRDIVQGLKDPRKIARHVRKWFTLWYWKRRMVRVFQNVDAVRTAHNRLYSRLRPVHDHDALMAKHGDIVNGLRENGYYTIERFLAPDRVDRIVDELRRCNTQFLFPHWEVHQNIASRCPTIADLMVDEFLLDVASLYIRARARLIYYTAWNTHPTGERATGTDSYHSDRTDLNFLVFFFYLTDVDEESGPHEFVSGSHRNRPRECGRWWASLGHRIDERAVRNYFPPEAFRRFCLPKGSLIIEDTYGVHRGTPARTKPRTMLELTYGLHAQSEGDVTKKDLARMPDDFYAKLNEKQRLALDYALRGRRLSV